MRLETLDAVANKLAPSESKTSALSVEMSLELLETVLFILVTVLSKVLNADAVASLDVPSVLNTSAFKSVIADSLSPILGSRRLSQALVPSPSASIQTYG